MSHLLHEAEARTHSITNRTRAKPTWRVTTGLSSQVKPSQALASHPRRIAARDRLVLLPSASERCNDDLPTLFFSLFVAPGSRLWKHSFLSAGPFAFGFLSLSRSSVHFCRSFFFVLFYEDEITERLLVPWADVYLRIPPGGCGVHICAVAVGWTLRLGYFH